MIHWADNPRVLIVDDSPPQIALVERILAADGYNCLSANNGREALARCRTDHVDLVLTDVNMPDVDGLTVCRTLKGAPDTCLIPVLVMTADVRTSHLAALRAGADDVLPKPLSIPELRARIGSAVRTKRYADGLDNAGASLVMLGATIEARDRHTNGHCQRLARYGSALRQRIGVSRQDLLALEQGGYVHDLGKIAIPDAILFKPGPLTADEFALVKTHPIVGDRICEPLRTLERVRTIVRSHHETLDGRGYPDGLRGAAVPLLAQIISIVDVYDALTSDRPYRQALTTQAALETLFDEAHGGTRDVALVDEFAAMIAGDRHSTVQGFGMNSCSNSLTA
jgi:putative two-component system response regulator